MNNTFISKKALMSVVMLVMTVISAMAVTVDVKPGRYRIDVPDTTKMVLAPDVDYSLKFMPDSLTTVYVLSLDAHRTKARESNGMTSSTAEFSWKEDYLEHIDRSAFNLGEQTDSASALWIKQYDRTYQQPDGTVALTRTKYGGGRYAYVVAAFTTPDNLDKAREYVDTFDSPMFVSTWKLWVAIAVGIVISFWLAFFVFDETPVGWFFMAVTFALFGLCLVLCFYEGVMCYIRGYAGWEALLDGFKYLN